MSVWSMIPYLLQGLAVTLEVTLGGAVVAFVAAWLSGLGKLSRHWYCKWPAVAYIEIFRGTSALVQLFWFYYALPMVGVSLSPLTAGILVLGLNVGSYGAEIVRGAIQAVPHGQTEAAISLNLSPFQRMRLVIVPQALVAMLPPGGNLVIELLKNSALVSLITLADLTFQGKWLWDRTLQTGKVFGLLLVVYFLVAFSFLSLVRWLERRLTRGRRLEAIR